MFKSGIKVTYIKDISDCNIANCPELAPFQIKSNVPSHHVDNIDNVEDKKSTLLCDTTFNSELVNTYVMKILQNTFNVVDSGQTIRSKNDCDEYWIVYYTMFDWMSIENWHHVLDEKHLLIKLTDVEVFAMCGSNQTSEAADIANSNKKPEFIAKMDNIIQEFRN